MRNLLAPVLVALSLAACTPQVTIGPASSGVSEPKIGRTVALEQEAMARVGEAVYGEFNYRLKGGVRLVRDYADTFGVGARVAVPAGANLTPATVGSRDAHCTPFAAYTEPLAGNPTRPVCFYDEDGDGAFDEYWVAGTLEATANSMSPPVPYTSGEEAMDAGGYKKEIVYQGVQGDTLRLMYREYIDNLARPAFQQDLTYTLESDGPTDIAFQSVEIEVLEAGNNVVHYRVLNGFDAGE